MAVGASGSGRSRGDSGSGRGRGDGGRGEGGTDDDGDVDEDEEMEDEDTGGDPLVFERSSQIISRGDFYNKPLPGQPKIAPLDLLNSGKGVRMSHHKKTFKAILRDQWRGDTINNMGSVPESFLSTCIEELMNYYDYLQGWGKEKTDAAALSHLKLNVKQNKYQEKRLADKRVEKAREKGDAGATRRTCRLHYLSEEAWGTSVTIGIVPHSRGFR